MMVSGTEYVVVIKPLCWGGGRYVQTKVVFAKKGSELYGRRTKNENITNSKAPAKD